MLVNVMVLLPAALGCQNTTAGPVKSNVSVLACVVVVNVNPLDVALITPAVTLIVVPSGCTAPKLLVVAVATPKVTAPVLVDTVMPVPATADVTPVLVKVTAPVEPLTPMPVPAVALVTPVVAALMVTAPVAPDTVILVPATILVTPVLLNVTVPPKLTGLPLTPKPVPPVTVTLELVNLLLAIDPANMVLVTVPVSAVVKMPVTAPVNEPLIELTPVTGGI